MAVRVFQLAKELGMSSKDLITFLHTQGHKPGSHMSNVEDTVAQILRDRLKPKLQKERAAKEKQEAGRGKAAATATAPNGGAAAGGDAAGVTVETTEKGRGEKARAARAGVSTREAEKDDERGERRGRDQDRDRDKGGPRVRRFFPSKEDVYDSGPRFGSVRRKTYGKRRRQRGGGDEAAAVDRPQKVEVNLPITVRDLSALMAVKAQSIISILWREGQQCTINDSLDEDQVTTVGIEYGIEVEFKARKKKRDRIDKAVDEIERYTNLDEDLVPRAPVITFLGHVDHGKTSLLDNIRSTKVTAREAGGITQHIGAYRVDKDNVHLVFIDTPGHQAFTEMRARGANVTDIAVLVVAADDGVMPQTEEALNHAKAAGVAIVVAINKVDRPNANSMRVKQQLASLNLQPVEWGGETEFVEVSAITGQGIDTLLETLSLTSEMLELKANPKRPAVGVVLEAEASPSRGVVVTLLVRDGTLRLQDNMLCGAGYGRVKGMWLNGTDPVAAAGPSSPITVTGLNRVPDAGDKLYVFDDREMPKVVADQRLEGSREPEHRRPAALAWDTVAVPEVPLILKADGQGTLEAVKSSLSTLSTDDVKLKILHTQVGGINQADVSLADTCGAVVVGFNVQADELARTLADERGVEIRHYAVIYKLIDDMKLLLQGQLAPETFEEVHGHAEIRQIFKASRLGSIAGCMVLDGVIHRSDKIRLNRDGKVVHTGDLSSLRRFKDDVREVKAGFDCGIKLAGFDDIQVGDNLEAFAVVEKPRQL